ncbi:phosphoserine transaminase [Pontibacterium sinense]|uniref:phosphoserine transaminase n=1 Tax=Pontibacterium sinense TaxID=2781979 RepID=UPI0035305C31
MNSHPDIKPKNPYFSSGPCRKRPGYNVADLDITVLGRSHRSTLGKHVLKRSINDTAELLGIPDDYKVGIVPASDTGAVEMVLWSMLGTRPIDVCSWESFGAAWYDDITEQLQLNANHITANYGELPDLTQTNPYHDIVFTWNGTSSGVKVSNGDWIAADREGLTICDATSAVFAMELPWDKLDVITFSWQKVIGGEGAHGVVVLSPRAIERLESYTPNWPLPKIFRMTKNGRLIEGIFEGATINTPSMLCVSDYQDALNWFRSAGGITSAVQTSNASLKEIEAFVNERDWIQFLARDPVTRSNTSVCLTLSLNVDQVNELVELLQSENVAYDIGSYRDAPPGLRIWCGATVSTEDVRALLPWIEWGYHQVTMKN